MASLHDKPCEDSIMRMLVPSSWSWRIKAARLLIHLAAWVLGAGFDVEVKIGK